MLWASLGEAAVAHGTIGWDGTLELWLDMLLPLFAAADSHHTLPVPWEDVMPDLHDTQLQTAWVATLGGRSCATLVC